MKKLMIAAAAAAMVGGASAAEPLDAQVYDFTATVKTSECSGKSYTDVCAGKSVQYRIQKTKKLYGKFWGCHCEVIADPGDSSNQGIVCSIGSAQALYGVSRYVDGNGIPTDSPKDANGNDNDIVQKSCIFWMNAKDEDGAFNGADWEWSLLYRLGKKCANIEGMFTLTLYSDVAATTDVATLSGAGYGTCVTTYKNGKNVVCLDESAYIQSMSGNIVGTWNVQNEAISSGCAYCGGSDTCEVLPFCDACQFDLTNASAEAVVFGTFTIKYNAAESKSVNNGKFIDQLSLSSAKNKAATAVFANVKKAAEEASKGTPDPDAGKSDTVKALEAAYKTAKDALVTKTEAAAVKAQDYADAVAATNKLATEDEYLNGTDKYKTAEYISRTNTLATVKAVADGDWAKLSAAAQTYVRAATSDSYSATEVETAKNNVAKGDLAAAEEAIKSRNKYLDAQEKVDDYSADYDKSVAEAKAKLETLTKDVDTAENEADKAAADVVEAQDNLDDAQIRCLAAGGDCL